MFTYLSNLVWGAEEEKDATGALDASEMEHSAREEAGEWLVINTGAEQPAEKSKSGESLLSLLLGPKKSKYCSLVIL